MKNKNILKRLYSLISTIDSVYVNISVEEIFENQTELHLNNKKIKKYNIDYGVRIIIKNNQETIYKSLTFFNYEDMFQKVINYIEETLNLKLIKKNTKVVFKINGNKNILLNKQQKYKIMTKIMKSLKGYETLKVSFYEKKENKFIIQNTSKYILNIKNFYTKIMLKGIIQNNQVYDFILSDCGYKNIKETNVNNLIYRFKEISNIKINKKTISNGVYDLILSNNCGTIFHEMFGHNLELDLINKNNLKLFKIGNNLNNELITFIDNPNYNSLLNIQYDDYINPTSSKVLIEQGVVKHYISTSKSENYKYFPSTRMTNTYLKPNKKAMPFDISKIKSGIYLYKISSGKLYLEEQKFEIVIDAGYVIKDGYILQSISNLTFIVDVFDFINKIKYVGNDLNFVPTICWANSGNVFVYAGTPTVYVKDIYIIQK